MISIYPSVYNTVEGAWLGVGYRQGGRGGPVEGTDSALGGELNEGNYKYSCVSCSPPQ